MSKPEPPMTIPRALALAVLVLSFEAEKSKVPTWRNEVKAAAAMLAAIHRKLRPVVCSPADTVYSKPIGKRRG